MRVMKVANHMNVLVYETNAQERMLVEKIVGLHEAKVHSADSPEKVLAVWGREAIDLAFIDLDADPKGAIELVRKMRASAVVRPKQGLIIVATENNDTSDVLDILEAGASEFLQKPYNRAAVEAKVTIGKRSGLSVDAISMLTEEHRAILRVTHVLEYIAGMLPGKVVPKKLLEWVTSTSFLLDSELHHRKEEHFIVSFLDVAIKAHRVGKDQTIFSRSSLKSIETEHSDLITLKREIQICVGMYTDAATEERAAALKDAIEDYVHLLREHMTREERFLFSASRSILTEEDNARLLREFRDVEVKVGIPKIDERLKLLLEAEALIGRKAKAKGSTNDG